MTTPDCKSCGACCLGEYEDGRGFADCTVADVKRMSREVRDRLVRDATPTRMSPKWGKMCAFLRGKPGKEVSCHIYETRPGVCRAFRPGSKHCKDVRYAAGFGGEK